MPLINIASVNIPNWQGSLSNISLRIYANASFTASSGNIVPKTVLTNLPSLGTFYVSLPCSISGTELTIPATTLESTTDSPDNPDATFTAMLWDGASNKPIQTLGTVDHFAVPPSPAFTTWNALFTSEANQ